MRFGGRGWGSWYPRWSMTDPQPARTFDELWKIFDPTLEIDPDSPLYVPRNDHQLRRLSLDLQRCSGSHHAFLCGHRGSGKTTELKRLRRESAILERYLPVYLTVQRFGTESVHLTHDALLLEVGLNLVEEGKRQGLPEAFGEALHEWGRDVVNTFRHNQVTQIEAGAGGNAWLALFKALLQSRREWTREERETLEPKVQDLIQILDRLVIELREHVGQEILVIVDDLEKGDSPADREMHHRLFLEHYEALVQPAFSIVYTLPVYFRAMPETRIPESQLYAFSAVRLYDREHKCEKSPPLDKEGIGYGLMQGFVDRRVETLDKLFAPTTVDELLRIGSGLFRETASAFQKAANHATFRGGSRVEPKDVEEVFHDVKKLYQPMIRGDVVRILTEVLESEDGWVDGVEPHLQSRAVVEYENHDLWLDLRYPLKQYVRRLAGRQAQR